MSEASEGRVHQSLIQLAGGSTGSPTQAAINARSSMSVRVVAASHVFRPVQAAMKTDLANLVMAELAEVLNRAQN